MNIIGHARPRLADVQCSRLKFEPGDRILVRVYRTLGSEERRRLQKTVERWSGGITEVLIIDGTQMEMEIVKPRIIK